MNPDSEKYIQERPRPFLTRPELATLVGMTLCVASLFLTWKREPVHPELLQSMPVALVRNVPPPLPVTGFTLPLHWPFTLCAVFCGAGLLVQPKPRYQSHWVACQVLSAAICLLLPILRFAVQPGVMVALAGGGLMLFGVLERFGIGITHKYKEEV